ncbi:MAG: hypothetical protein U1F57_05285 [bacterium]
MQCFNHVSQPAVGICKNCSKGICRDCLVQEGYGLACKGSCETEVKALWQIIQRNKSVYQKTAGVYLRAAALFLLMAVVFSLYPILFPGAGPEMRYLFFGVGGLMFLGGVVSLVNANRMKRS